MKYNRDHYSLPHSPISLTKPELFALLLQRRQHEPTLIFDNAHVWGKGWNPNSWTRTNNLNSEVNLIFVKSRLPIHPEQQKGCLIRVWYNLLNVSPRNIPDLYRKIVCFVYDYDSLQSKHKPCQSSHVAGAAGSMISWNISVLATSDTAVLVVR